MANVDKIKDGAGNEYPIVDATAVHPSDLAKVATTGSYNDLTGKPTIPPGDSEGQVIESKKIYNRLSLHRTSTSNPNYEVIACQLSNSDRTTTSSSSPIPDVANAVINRGYYIRATDSKAISQGLVAGEVYSVLEGTNSWTNISSRIKRWRIRLTDKLASYRPEGVIRISITPTYGTGDNFGSFVWNWMGCLRSTNTTFNPKPSPYYQSYSWCEYISSKVADNWKIIGPCWESSSEGWFFDIYNSGNYKGNTNNANIVIEAKSPIGNITPLNYAKINGKDLYVSGSSGAIPAEPVEIPTDLQQWRNGTWETVNIISYRHVPEIPSSVSLNKVNKIIAGTNPEVQFNLFPALKTQLGDASDVVRIPIIDGNGSATVATFAGFRTCLQLFNYIKGKLGSLATKSSVTDSDISGTIADSHIASASAWNGKQDALSFTTADEITEILGGLS